MTDWIVIPNWNRFQHYKDRDPPWIKDYIAQLHNPDYLALTFAQRGLLHDLRLLYAASHGQTPYVPAALTGALSGRTSNAQLKRLNDAGLIDVVASRPLALARSREGFALRREEPHLSHPPYDANGDRPDGDFQIPEDLLRSMPP